MNEGDADADAGQLLFDDEPDKPVDGLPAVLNETGQPSESKSKDTGKIEDIAVDEAFVPKDEFAKKKEDIEIAPKKPKATKSKGPKKPAKVESQYFFDMRSLQKNPEQGTEQIVEQSKHKEEPKALGGASKNVKSKQVFVNIWRSKTTVLNYLQLNLKLKTLMQKLPKTKFDCFDDHSRLRLQDYKSSIALISSGDFNWTDFFGSDDQQGYILDTVFLDHWSKFDYMLTYSTPLQSVFPLPLIDAFLSEDLKSLPLPTLKKGLSFKASLLTMLWQYHLNHDTKHLLRIDHKNLKMLSPLIRSSIRYKNRTAAGITSKYFSDEWNLTKFMLRLSSSVFQEEITLCDEGLLMQSRYLAVILAMCDLGIFPESEITELVNLIFRAVGALVKREESLCAVPLEAQEEDSSDEIDASDEEDEESDSSETVEAGSGSGDSEAGPGEEGAEEQEENSEAGKVTKHSIYGVKFETLYNLQKCKQQIVGILSHIAVLINDLTLLGLLPWRNNPQLTDLFGLRPLPKSRPAVAQRSFLFESKTLCNQIILIASKAFFKSSAYDLLMRELEINTYFYNIRHEEPIITKLLYTMQSVRSYSQDLMEMITNPQDDIIISSSRILDDNLFEYLTSKDPSGASKSIATQVANFSNRLIAKFEDGLVKNFDEDENYSIELRILLEEIQAFVATNTKNLGVSVNFALNNVQTVLLGIAFVTETLSQEKKVYIDSRCCDLALSILGDISGDAISQGFLFTDFNWDLFQEMLTQRPHLLALILSRAFKNLPKNLNISYKEQLLDKLLPLFERLISKSTELIKNNFSYLYADLDTCADGVGVVSGELEEAANRLMLYLISVHSFSKTILGLNRNRGKEEEDFFNIDLRLQLIMRDSFFPLFFEGFLKRGNEFIAMRPYQGYIPRFDFEKYAYEGFDYGQGITHDKIRGAIFSIAWSLTELMAKTTSRLYLAHDEKMAVDSIKLDTFYSTFAYLTSIDNGIQLKSILLKFASNFIIFRGNNAFTSDFWSRELNGELNALEILYGWDNEYDAGAEYHPKQILEYLISEMEFLGHLRGQGSLRVQEGGLKDSIKIYIFKGLFPSIYKFCQGFLGLLTISNSDISRSKTRIQELLDTLIVFVRKLACFQKNVTNTFGIILTNGKADNLVDYVIRTAKQAGKDNLGPHEEVNVGIGTGDSDNFQERDEKLCPALAEVRSILRKVSAMIEESCPAEFQPYIDSFTRKNALKRRINKLDGIFDSKLQKSRNGRPAFSNASSQVTDIEAETEKLRVKMNQIRRGYGSMEPMEHFKLASEIYQIRKSLWLKEDSESNSFFKYLDDHPQDTDRYIEFTLTMLQENLFEFVKKDQNLNRHSKLGAEEIDKVAPAMIVDRLPYTLLSQMERLCSQTDRGRKRLFEMVGKSIKYGSLIISLNRCIMALFRYNFLKTFHDMTYYQMNRLADKLCDTLDTFAEGGNKNFRKCISNREYCEQVNSSYNPLIIDFATYLDRMMIMSEFVYLKPIKFVTMAEKPENFHITSKLINVMLSCLSGPDVEGQSHIYTWSIDKFTMIFERIIHDINSPFYELKLRVVDYFSMLLEEVHVENDTATLTDPATSNEITVKEMNKKIINHTIMGIRYNLIENQIVACLKKLYVSRLFKSKPWFKAKPIEKLKQDFERQKQELLDKKAKLISEKQTQNGQADNSESAEADVFGLGDLRVREIEKKLFELDMKIDKLNYLESFSTDFEDRNAIIFPEFEDAVKLPHYRELTSLYIKDPEFSEHIIIKLCMRLQGMLFSIAKNSDQMNILNKERISEMYSYYGRSVPEHLQEMIDCADCKRLDPRTATERVNVFMFLSQITQNIELNLMTSEGPISKHLDFKLPAQSFFLSNQTKKNFMYQTDPEEMVDKAIETFPKFLIEMKRNYHFYNKSKLLYTISASDPVTVYKVIIWYISFAINVLLVLSARTSGDGSKEFVFVGRLFFTISPMILSALCIVVLALWSQGKYPELVLNAMQKHKRHFSKQKPPLSIKFRVYVWETILRKRTPFQMIFTIIFCILGAFWNEYFLTVLLMMIMFISNTASYIVKSITTHAKQLGLTFVMAIFVMYIFSFIAYTNYNKSWDGKVDNDGTIEMCTDLWECTMYSVMFGFLNGGGLGDSFGTPEAHGQTGAFFGRFFFDVLFFILISVVALNIAFGIIIDTFASMRDEQARRINLLKTTCVVCKKTKAELEQSGESARMHISSKHSIWNYVNYMLYLNLTEKSKFNSVENAVYEALRASSTDWIPSQGNRIVSENQVLTSKVASKMKYLSSKLKTQKTELDGRLTKSQDWYKKLVAKIIDTRAKDQLTMNLGAFTEKIVVEPPKPAETTGSPDNKDKIPEATVPTDKDPAATRKG